MDKPDTLFIVRTPDMIFHANDEHHAAWQWQQVVQGKTDVPVMIDVAPFDPNTVEVESITTNGVRFVKDKKAN